MNPEDAEIDRALDQERMLEGALARDKREEALRLAVNTQIELGGDQPLAQLIRRAEKDAVDALRVLAIAQAEDTQLIRELQNRVYRATALKTWLMEFMQRGEAALKSLNEESGPE